MDKTVTRRIVSPEAAQEITAAAIAYAKAQGWEIAAAVVDPFGGLVAFSRTAGVAAPIGDFAQDKAYTAGTLGKSSKAFGERMASGETLSLGLSTRHRLLTWGGGVAILDGDTCIGGLGVSGAQEHEDIACAEAAIRAAGLEPR
ncbi:GlcG/HbpS family heme-binding protein [Mameliella sediminis]|uniref:GlcG/HbpS family heme-binding protein n=1 Tax=Mameliella sediminis TaxID=2836866 RepID=UPI001C47A247|nr:heme-binding protein [Mameliella sediminis]MBY6116935.1 heme-binding protein [Antarctobacter heliothermus]MBY6146688.1 heme-binding protein [Mameliella alba]MBV7397188.1 heme-binding protein [Mameliella sediminis]MBY6163636.1 heme-binding protein [Mameliella alba]MBY6172033.1 heme-binding protein [Mameliella alba]